MIEWELKWPYRLLAMLLCAVVFSCTKDTNRVITTPPAIDSTAVVAYKGRFVNGPYGSVMGSVELLKQDTTAILSLKNFSASSGPDLHVYLSKEQQPVTFLDLGSLRSRTGDQAYTVPAGADVKTYKYALIHCKAYNHLFGGAVLQEQTKTIVMQLYQSIKNVFVQLSDSLEQLSETQYTQPSKQLFGSSIGKHVRHIIELFICLQKGYEAGVVNYEKRKRDLLIETDKEFARELLHGIYQSLAKPNKSLQLEANYNEHTDETITIETNYYREVVYNLEHTVHHMALIRVGINEVSRIDVPKGFGVAASTIKHQQVCAQ